VNKATLKDLFTQIVRRLSPLAVPFLTMFAWFWVVALWFPLIPGRDMMTYYQWYRGMLQIEPESPWLMLFRMPLTPLFYGVCFDLLGKFGIEFVLALLYAGSITSVFAVLREFSERAAWTLNVLLGVNLWLFKWFNAVGSETLQTVLLCLWFCCTFFAMRSAKMRVWIGIAALVFLMVLNRPGNQTFVLCFLLPLFVVNASAKRRLMLSGVFLATYIAAHLAFSTSNYLRYGHFCISKFGDAHLPFLRLFVQEQMISPDNGPASQELAQFVDQQILTNPVYSQYEITQEIFFRYSTQRMFNSLIAAGLQNGWNGDFPLLRKAAMESIWRDPKGSFLRYLEHVLNVFGYPHRKPIRISNLRDKGRAFARERETRYARYAANGLTLPTEGDLIPPAAVFAVPEGRRTENWFGLQRDVKEWKVSSSTPSSSSALFEMSRKFIPNYYWLLLGVLSLVVAGFTGPIDWRIPLLTAVALVSVFAAICCSARWEFRFPFDPILTAFTLHAIHCLIARAKGLRTARFARLSLLLKRLLVSLSRLKLER